MSDVQDAEPSDLDAHQDVGAEEQAHRDLDVAIRAEDPGAALDAVRRLSNVGHAQ
jgi:hypothetical protein